MIRIRDSVVYREYNNQTFIIDTKQQCSLRIDAPIKKILDLFVNGTEPEEAKQKLMLLYPSVDSALISDNIDATVKFLIDNRLISDNADFLSKRIGQANTRYFQRYTIRERILYSALFELTYRCPEKCVHCYLEPDLCSQKYTEDIDAELSTEKIKELLDQLEELNVMEITFTDGEPFARKDIFEILKYANSKRFSINIFSNAILLNDSDIEKLSKLRINCFHASVYSHISQKHDSITRIQGSFARTVSTLRKLSENGIYVNFKFVLMESNKDDFDGVIELAKSMGASVQLISSISPSANGNCDIADLGVCNDIDLENIIQRWNNISDYSCYNGDFSKDDPICEAGRNCLCIDPYGKVKPCNAFDYVIGDVNETSLGDIWKHSEKLKSWQNATKIDLKDCYDCQYASACNFCPGTALKYTGNMFKKYDTACRYAKIQFKLLNGI